MIVSELKGGMGNQMFQYALGRYLAIKNNTDLFLDIVSLSDRTPRKDFVFRDYDLDIFNIEEKFAPAAISAAYGMSRSNVTKAIQKIVKPKSLRTVFETDFRFQPGVLNTPDNAYLNGYWQTEDYFLDIETTIRKDFTFKKPLSQKAQEIAAQIIGANAVCLNVRRGDFVNNPTHGTLGMDYYNKAEEIMLQKVQSPVVVFVFSDEIDWCRENIKLASETIYVGHEYAGEKFRDYMGLMMQCKNFIIPNSSFAWWSAWLCSHPGKEVIAPKNWFPNAKWDTDDLLPKKWIQL